LATGNTSFLNSILKNIKKQMRNNMQAQTKIFYLVGASGAGKDTMLNAYKQQAISQKEKIIIAHRYITRANTATAHGENFISLSNEEFIFRKNNQLFALNWQANNCCYGVGIEIDAWLKKGLSIIVNGSRSYLLEAQKKYPENMVTIMVDVSEDILRQRLLKRQRESIEEIDARIHRHRQLKNTINVDEEIKNLTSVSDAVDNLSTIINKYHNKSIESA
jgi:ribose 1,5-bisphosphokinase